MKTYNIWKCNKEHTSPTGPWSFLFQCQADNQKLALKLAVALYGFGDYQIYEGDL